MSVSDIGNRISQEYLLQILRGKVDDASRQSSTGKISADISGLGSNGLTNSISYRNDVKLTSTYTSNLNTLKTRLSVTDTTLTSITKAARDLVAQLQSQLQDTTPSATILSNSAKSQMQVVADKLNTQADGRYVFSGQNFDDPAYTGTGALLTSMGSVVTAALANPATTATSIVTSAQTVTGANVGISTAAINGGTVSIKGDDQTTISTSLTANTSGFSDIMRGMAIVASLPQPTTAAEQKNYWSMINGAIALLQQGATAVDNSQAVMGDQANIADSLLDQHEDTQTNLQTYIANTEDVDIAAVATKFSALQNQLQASYSIISATKDLSLVKYI